MAKILIIFGIMLCVVYAEESAFNVLSFSTLKLKKTVRQSYEESCGAAALATLMTLYGKTVTEEDILQKVSKTDMLSFAELANVADTMGFRAVGYRMTIEMLNKVKIPVIAKIDNRDNYAHFVVVHHHNGDFISIFDPNFGYYIENKREFWGWWSQENKGVVLIAIPKESVKIPSIELRLPSKELYSQ